MKVTRTRVEVVGGHEHVTVWVDGANVGTLIMGREGGAWLAARLAEPGEAECSLHGTMCHGAWCAVREGVAQ